MKGVVPNLLERSQGLIDLTLRNKPDVTRYNILVQRVLTDASTSPTLIIEDVPRGSMFRSPTLMKKKLGLTMDSNRGLTRIAFDLSDYADGGGGTAPTVPFEEETVFLRVQEYSQAANAYLDSGPILVIPPTGFFNIRNPLLQLAGTAPNTAGLALGKPIEAPTTGMDQQMHLVFPFYSQTNNIRNLEAVGGTELFYSSGHYMGASKLPGNSDFGLTSAAYSEIILAGSGATAAFSIALGVATLV